MKVALLLDGASAYAANPDRLIIGTAEDIERSLVVKALTQARHNKTRAARLLGLSRKGLYLKRQRFGIEPPEPAVSIGA